MWHVRNFLYSREKRWTRHLKLDLFAANDGVPSSTGRYAVIGCQLKQNANEGCNSCASLACSIAAACSCINFKFYCLFYFTCDCSFNRLSTCKRAHLKTATVMRAYRPRCCFMCATNGAVQMFICILTSVLIHAALSRLCFAAYAFGFLFDRYTCPQLPR